MVYYKTRNTRAQNNGIRNPGGTAEHPGTVVEQRNKLYYLSGYCHYDYSVS